MRLLTRYILTEMGGPFAFSVGLFVALFLGTNVLSDLTRWSTQYHISPLLVVQLVVYRLPWILGYVFPMAMLLTTLLCFGRLSADSEIAAMLAGGASFKRLVMPALAAGIGVSLLTLGFNETLSPAGQRAETGLITALRGGTPGARRNVALLEHLPGDIQLGITAAEFHLGRGELNNLDMLISHRRRPCILIHADRALWQKEEWRLVNGKVWFDLNRDTGSSPPGTAQTLEVRLGSQRIKWSKRPEEIARETAAPGELTAWEMRQRIADKKARGADWQREIAPDLVELHNKYALPWTGFLFALLGAPLGIRPRRSSKGLAYGICLAIIFAYFALWHTLLLFGKSGSIPPAVAPWTPNLVLAAIGTFLLQQAETR